MAIDYKLAASYELAARAIDNAINYATKGIDSLLMGGNYRPSKLAFSSPGSDIAPDPKLYRNDKALPTIDDSVRANYRTPEGPKAHMTAGQAVRYLLGL